MVRSFIGLKTTIIIVGLLLATACSQQPVSPPNNPCFRWVATGDLKTLQNNFYDCKKATSQHGTTLLMLASARDQIEIMDFLLSQGADLNTTDFNGDTALFYAATASKSRAIGWLLSHGAATKSFHKNGITPFMVSLQAGNKDSFDFFLHNENQIKELNIPNEDGWTPLFFAVRQENNDLLKSLLDLGADPQFFSKENETPLNLAEEQQWSEGIALLKSRIKTSKKKIQ